jgi:hypothetical protein
MPIFYIENAGAEWLIYNHCMQIINGWNGDMGLLKDKKIGVLGGGEPSTPLSPYGHFTLERPH